MNNGLLPLTGRIDFAFKAILTTNTAYTSGNAIVVPFAKTVYDFMQCFNPLTSRARITKPGLYQIDINLTNSGATAMDGQLNLVSSSEPQPIQGSFYETTFGGWNMMRWDRRGATARSHSCSAQFLITNPCELWLRWSPGANGTFLGNYETHWALHMLPVQIP